MMLQIFEMLEIIPEEWRLAWIVGCIGFVISLLLTVYLYYEREKSIVAFYYALGSVITFQVGGFNFIIGVAYIIGWGLVVRLSPLGLIGGYALIILALVQFMHDKKKSNVGTIEGTSEE